MCNMSRCMDCSFYRKDEDYCSLGRCTYLDRHVDMFGSCDHYSEKATAENSHYKSSVVSNTPVSQGVGDNSKSINSKSLIGLILGIMGFVPIGLIFSIIGLVNSKSTYKSDIVFAKISLAVNVILVIFMILIIIWICILIFRT